jgi:hypothetical protein
MAGTDRDFSALTAETEGQPCTTSSTQDEVDIITPPSWATWYGIICNTTDVRVGLSQSETMTTASVLEATDEHSVIKADVWQGDPLIGGDFYVSSGGTSVNYSVKFYRVKPV